MTDALEDVHLDGSPGETEELDGRVQQEFECMNTTSDVINRLENELDHARSKFRSMLSESTHHLNLLCKKLGKCINKSRPYYELLKQARGAQMEAQRAVQQYQRANSMYLAAKETVALAEERMHIIEDNTHQLEPAWQDMLNHATIKFNESKKDKAVMEQNHLEQAAKCANIDLKRKHMEKDMRRTIQKARPYFEMKERLEIQLQQEKQNVEDLQMALHSAKSQYQQAMRNLEIISNQVHLKRQVKALPMRTPGVGAENQDTLLPPIDIDCASHQSVEGVEEQHDSASTSSSYDERLCSEDQDPRTAEGDHAKNKVPQDGEADTHTNSEVCAEETDSTKTNTRARGSVCSHHSDEVFEDSRLPEVRAGRSASNVSNVSQELSLKVADLYVDSSKSSQRADQS